MFGGKYRFHNVDRDYLCRELKLLAYTVNVNTSTNSFTEKNHTNIHSEKPHTVFTYSNYGRF